MTHMYYFGDGLNLEGMRKDAKRRAKNDRAETKIHFHRAEEKCEGHEHEHYGYEQVAT